MRKKRFLVLVLSIVMLIGGSISVYADTTVEDGDTLHENITISYYADCNDICGAGSTQVMSSEENISSTVTSEVILYVKSRWTGAISEYSSATAYDTNYANAEVEIHSSKQSTYIGYEASTSHYARVERNGDIETGTSYLVAENHN